MGWPACGTGTGASLCVEREAGSAKRVASNVKRQTSIGARRLTLPARRSTPTRESLDLNRTRLALIAILGILTLLALVRLGNIDISLDTLRRIQPGYLAVAIAVHYSGFAVRGATAGGDSWPP